MEVLQLTDKYSEEGRRCTELFFVIFVRGAVTISKTNHCLHDTLEYSASYISRFVLEEKMPSSWQTHSARCFRKQRTQEPPRTSGPLLIVDSCTKHSHSWSWGARKSCWNMLNLKNSMVSERNGCSENICWVLVWWSKGHCWPTDHCGFWGSISPMHYGLGCFMARFAITWGVRSSDARIWTASRRACDKGVH